MWLERWPLVLVTVRPNLVVGLSRVVARFTGRLGLDLHFSEAWCVTLLPSESLLENILLFEIELAEIGTFIDHFQSAFASCDRADWVMVQQSIVQDFIDCRLNRV